MAKKPSYEELEQKVKELKKETAKLKQTDEALRESEEKYRNLFKNTALGLGIADKDGKIIVFNDAMLRPGGYSREDMTKIKNLADLYYIPDDRNKIIATTQQQGYLDEAEVLFKRKDGTSYDALLSLRLIQIKGKTCWQAMVQDISERKRTEEKLRKSEEKYRNILENIEDSYFEVNQIGDITFFNEAFSKITGYPPDELMGMKNDKYLDQENGEKVFKKFNEVWKTGIPTKLFEYELIRKNGEKRTVQTSTSLVTDENGQKIGFRGIIRDVSDRKQAEEALRESERHLRISDQINNIFLAYPDEKMYEEILEVILKVMESEYGTFGYFDEQGAFVAPAVTKKIYWDKCNVPEKDIIFQKGAFGGIWGKSTKEKKTLLDNDGPFNTPEGHIPIENTIVTPITFHNEVISAIHLANKPNGYDEEDKEMLTTIADQIAPVLYARLQRDKQEKERKRAEESLTESKEELRTIVDSAPVQIWYKDRDNKIIRVNQAGADAFGKRIEDIEGKPVIELFPEADSDHYYDDDLEVINSGKPKLNIIEEMLITSGERRYVCTDKVPYMDKNGKINGVIAFVRDITEGKRAEEALRESEERYRQLFENSVVGIDIATKSGKILESNDAIKKMMGYSTDELSHLNLAETYVNPKEREDFLRIIDQDGKVENLEVQLLTKKGKPYWANLSTRPIQLKGESVLLTSVINIQDRKEAEEALRESESRFHNLFDLSPQAIALTAVETGRYIDVNDKLCELTKYSKDELIGRTSTEIELYSKDNRGRFIKELQASGEVHGLEMDFKTKDGSIINTLMFSKTIRISSEPLILTILFDMTDRKRLEAQFQQAQKMEAIGTLAGGIAHDFNNLLMGIQGRASLMLMDTATTHPHYEHLQGIEDYVKSAADLTKQLLGFARGGKYEVKPTDLNELIKNQNRMFGRTKKEITIHGKYEKNLWIAEVDQGQIEQVLLNLYVNAWQSMPGGGDLYIQTENVALDENYIKPFEVKPGKYVKISVTDTGVGMDETTRQRIFDPFFTTKEMGRGTGLGLATVYGIIKNHEGFINVYSEKGEGTTFNIYLPASEKEIIEEKELAKEVIKGTETVLLVDDENVIIYAVELLLKEMGYKTLIARSGKETVKIYKKNKDKIDVVILDMIMPDMGGGETYDRLKEINPDIKVLLSSGYSINGEATEILERGCNGFIQKPYRSRELSQKIRKILDS